MLHGDDYDLYDILRKDEGKRTYVLESTGAKLTYEHAINILSRYASSLVSLASPHLVLPIADTRTKQAI